MKQPETLTGRRFFFQVPRHRGSWLVYLHFGVSSGAELGLGLPVSRLLFKPWLFHEQIQNNPVLLVPGGTAIARGSLWDGFMLEIDRATKRRCSRRPALVDGAW